jgi:hypothetical protein
MKNRWLLIGIVVVVLIVIVVIVVALSNKPQQSAVIPPTVNPFADAVDTGSANTVLSPADFSVNFYKWYIGNREADPSFPSADQLQNGFTQWMTPQFILEYQATVSDPDNDADPILYAQDDPRGWGSGISAAIQSQTDSASTVTVAIGSGSSVHNFTLQLVKSNGQWLISSISGTY